MDKSNQDKIKFFFQNPIGEMKSQGEFSPLFLLRRNLNICFGVNPDNGKSSPFSCIWAGAMLVLTGIDLLAKYYKGDLDEKNNRLRFKEFIENNFEAMDNRKAELLYGVRCAILHEYGWRNKTDRFTYTHNEKSLFGRDYTIENISYHSVDFTILKREFEKSIENYRDKLLINEDLQMKFIKVFEEIGRTLIIQENKDDDIISSTGVTTPVTNVNHLVKQNNDDSRHNTKGEKKAMNPNVNQQNGRKVNPRPGRR